MKMEKVKKKKLLSQGRYSPHIPFTFFHLPF